MKTAFQEKREARRMCNTMGIIIKSIIYATR